MLVYTTTTPTVAEAIAAATAKTTDIGGAIWTIRPEVAQEVLATLNAENRPQKKTNQHKMAEAMRGGTFRLTGDSVKFGSDGTLKDGQNRLAACVRSGVPFTTVVNFGIAPNAMDVMDTGVGRSASDIFALAQVPYSAHMAQASTWLDWLTGPDPVGDRATRTPALLLARYNAEWQSLQMAWANPHVRELSKRFPKGVILAMYLLMSRTDAAKTDAFFTAWATGRNDMKLQKHPAEVMNAEMLRRRALTSRVHDRDLPLLIAAAWNAYRAKRGLTMQDAETIGAKMGSNIWPGV